MTSAIRETLRQRLDRLAHAATAAPAATSRCSRPGASPSLIGDGFFHVALAWLARTRSATSRRRCRIVFLAISIAERPARARRRRLRRPLIDRRKLMVGADLVRAGALGGIAALSAAGVLELWHIAALVVFVGAGDAFFNPASTAIAPRSRGERRPAPAGQRLRRDVPPGDGAHRSGRRSAGSSSRRSGRRRPSRSTPGRSCCSALRRLGHPSRGRSAPSRTSADGLRAAIVELDPQGSATSRSQPWIWATLISAMLSLLLFIGPGRDPHAVRHQERALRWGRRRSG